MKITKRQLKRIIKEKRARILREASSQAVVDVVADITPEMENMSKEELMLLDMQIDKLIAQLSESPNIVKITKRQLRRIIKEEKAKLLNEYTPADVSGAGPYSSPGNIEEEVAALEEVLNSLMVAGRNLPAPMDMRIQNAVEKIESALSILYGR